MRFNFYKLKAIAFVFVLSLAFAINANAQGLAGVKTIDALGAGPDNYTTLKEAIDSLNSKGVGVGGVTFNIVAGHTEAAPVGGYRLTASGTLTNPIVFKKNGAGANPLLTAPVGTKATNSTTQIDGVFALLGSDWVTIDGIDLVDTNSLSPATMEYGYAMFKVDTGNGCQHVTIQNCKITLNRNNFASGTGARVADGSVGIYALNSTADTSLQVVVTTASGSHSFNKFYTNIIQNANYGIVLAGRTESSPFTNADTDNEIGGSTPNSGNTIWDFGGGTSASNPSAGIRTQNQYNLKISYNNIDNKVISGLAHPNTLRGIYLQNGNNASVEVVNNTISLIGGGTTSAVTAIENATGGSGSGNTINISNNNIINSEYLTATSGAFYGIYNLASATNVNISNNDFDSLIYSTVSLTGTGSIYPIYNSSGTNVNITDNEVRGVRRFGTTGGTTIAIYVSSGTNQTVKRNEIHDISINGTGSSSTMYGIQTSTGTIVVDSNDIYNLSVLKTTASGVMYGVYNVASPTNENYNHNHIFNLNNAGTGNTFGMFFNTTTGTRTVSYNHIHDIVSKATSVDGIRNTSSSPNVFNNRIYNITTTSTSGLVSGISVTTIGTAGTVNIYNNLISDLKAPDVSSTSDAVRGINITATTSSSQVNITNNSIYLNATSTGTNFSVAGIFTTTSTTATTAEARLRNNIVVNLSTPKGSGFVSAYRRSSTTLTNFSTLSNNNVYFSGTPSAKSVIYYDGTNSDSTIALYKTRVSTRDQASITGLPNFVSTTSTDANFLNINTATPTPIESGALVVEPVTFDVAGNIRAGNPGYPAQVNGGGSSPDIGAWEFDGTAAAPSITFTSLTPPGEQCIAVAHTVTVNIVPNIGTLDSAKLAYSFNGTPSGTIVMTNAGGGSYTALIPAAVPVNASVTWTVTAWNSGGLSKSFAGASYEDAPLTTLGLGIESDSQPLCLGDSATLTATLPPLSPLGNGGTTNGTSGQSPFGQLWEGMRAQYLVRASLMTSSGYSAGPLTSLAFNIISGTQTFPFENYTIKIGHTAATAVSGSAFLTDPLTTVFGPQQVAANTAVPSTKTFTFNSPFVWDGVSNVLIEICFQNDPTGVLGDRYSSNSSVQATTTSYTSVAGLNQDDSPTCSGSAPNSSGSSLPAFIFGAPPKTFSSYDWKVGGVTVGTTSSIKVSPTDTTTYVLTVVDPETGCSASDTFTLNLSNTTMGGVVTVGASGTYNTLTAAINAFNEVCVISSPVIFELIDTAYKAASGEVFPIVITHNSKRTALNPLTIRPAAGNSPIIYGSVATGGILQLLGADYVIIDGSNSGTDTRDLTIRNLSTATTNTALWIASSTDKGSSFNTIKNVNINGASASTTVAGILSGTASALGADADHPNNNNTIKNNRISRFQNGLYLRGNATNFDQNWLVTENIIGDSLNNDHLGFRGMLIGNANNFVISKNRFAGVISTTGSTSIMNAIQVALAVDSGLITGNDVSGVRNINTAGYGAVGINFGISNNNANVKVTNNFIYDIRSFGNATANRNAAGIAITGPGTGVSVINNTVYINHTPTAAAATTAAMFITGVVKSGSLDIRNNIFDARVETGNAYSYAHTVGDSVFSHFDNNALWTNGSNLANIRGTNATDIIAIRSAMPGFNMNSVVDEPLYVGQKDLHIPAATLTHLESKGQTIASISSDIDGDVRPGPAGSINGGGADYDIGADEFDGTPNLGDIVSPTVSIDSITPPTGACLPTAHTVYVKAQDASGVDTVEIRYTVSGVAQTPIKMNSVNSLPTDTLFTGTIPAVPAGAKVTYYIWVKDASVNGNTASTTSSSYTDAVFHIIASANPDSINAGATTQLSIVSPVSGSIGTGNVVNSTTDIAGVPYPTYWGNGRQQYLILASELNALGFSAGNITSLGFDLVTASTATGSTLNGYTINFANTTKADLATADAVSTRTTVWGPYNYSPSVGINTHTFDVPFQWDGTSNVLVEVCYGNGISGTSAMQHTLKRTNTTFVSTIRYNSDGAVANPCAQNPGTTASVRPNMILSGLGQGNLSNVIWTQTVGGGLSNDTIVNPTATPSSPGVYTYIASASNGICTYTDTVTVTALVPVAPIASFSSSHDTALVGANPTTVTFTDNSLNIPSSWRWDITPKSFVYVNGTDSSYQNPQVRFTQKGLYDVKLVVSNPAGSDSITHFAEIEAVLNYCASGATGATGQDIGNFKIWTGIDTLIDNGGSNSPATNNASANGTYTDFTQTILPPQIHFGPVYNFSIGHIASATSSTSGRSIYIDYNNDGDFDDVDERAFTSASFLAAGVNSVGTFRVPRTAKVGLTRMRVVLSNSFSSPAACGTFANGETEDYIVNIVPPVGDWFPPDFVPSSLSINPPGGSCLNEPHLVSIGVTDTTGVDSVWILWSVGGVTQTPIPMNITTGNIYTETIPAVAPGTPVAYSFFARDISANKNTSTFAGGTYIDALFNVNAQADADSVGLGNTIQLNAITPSFTAAAGNGTNTSSFESTPFYGSWGGNKRQILYTASELISAGLPVGPVNSVSFDVHTGSATTFYGEFTMYIDSTSQSDLTAGYLPSVNQVYGPTNYTPVMGKNQFSFANNFVWNGTSNLYVTICWSNGNAGGNGTAYVKTNTASANRARYSNIDSQTPANVCSNATGTATTSRADLAFGYPVSVTYSWTQSNNGGISATNISNPTATPTALGSYTYTVTANNGTCSFVDSVTVKVINIIPPTANFVANKTTALANTTVVTFNDSTGNLPTAWEWTFTPNTVTFVNNTSSNSQNPEVTFDAAGLYSVELIASNNAGIDTLLRPNYIEVLNTYCPSGTTSSTADSEIGKVTIGGFSYGDSLPSNNNPLANGNYRDYTGVPGLTIQKAVPVNVAISATTSGATYYAGSMNIFIDYNKNGVFDFPQERVFKGSVGNTATQRVMAGSFTPPIGALTGRTLLRVILDEGGPTDVDPCLLTYGWGETEDYIVNILPPPPGDYYAPDIMNIVLSPDSQCSPVPHTVSATITDTTSVASAEIVWSINGVPQLAIPMTNTGSTYSGVIPASGRGVVRFAISATDGSVNSNSGMSAEDSYQDEYFYVSAGNDKFIGAGQTASLSANTTLDKPFKITEFNLFNYTGGSGPSGNGSNATWPPQLPTSMYDDNIEITNLSNASANLSGYTLITEGIVHSFTFPAGTVVPPNGVVILHLGAGSTDAPNLVFSTGSGSLPSSGQNMGIILKDNMGNVSDAVATNSYTFGGTNGVTSSDWSGAGVSSPSGIAGATLQGADNNNNSNWVTGSPSTPVSIGFANPNLPTIVGTSTITWTGGVLTGPVVGSSITTPVHPTLGAYTYYAASSNGVCTYTDTVVVNVVAPPTVNIGPDSSIICGTTPRVLDAGNIGSTYVWRKDNIQVATTRTYSATTAGWYKVTVTNQAGLSASDSIYLSIGPAFTISLPDRTLCDGGTITVDAGSHVGYLWSTGATTQTIQITQPGSYHVAVTNSTGCVALDTFVVSPTTPPAFTLGADQTLCGSATFTLDAGNPGSTYLWSTGATTQTINASMANTYSVIVTTSSGCVLMDTVVVTNLPAPVVNLGADQSICPGSSITLNAGNAGSTFSWNTGATTQSINVTTAGVYIVTVTGANTCSTKDTVVVTLKAAPTVNLGNDLNICTSDTVTLDAGNPGASYLWSTGATTRTIRVSNAATYSVVVTHPTSGCTATDAVIVTNKPEPLSTFTVSSATGQSVTFLPTTTSGLQYAWNFGDPTSPSNTSQLTSPTHVFTAPGDYTVTLTVTSPSTGCKSTTSNVIQVNGVGNDFAQVYKLGAAPNPFVFDTKVKYTLPEPANNVTVEVYDMIGRKVATIIENEYQAANTYEYHYKNEDLQTSSGVYIVRLTVDGKVAFTRIVDAAKR